MTSKTTYHMTYIALFTIFIVICSWITVPMVIPFTMQTFAIFFTLMTLGGRLGTMTIITYVLLGLIGIPVFHGFQGGIGILLSNTGGYIIGFVFSALFFWATEKILGRNMKIRIFSMIIGLVLCYAFGTAWFIVLYSRTTGNIGMLASLSSCVFPFIVPDLIKMGLAIVLHHRLFKYSKLKI